MTLSLGVAYPITELENQIKRKQLFFFPFFRFSMSVQCACISVSAASLLANALYVIVRLSVVCRL